MAGDPLHTKLCEEYGCEVPIVTFAHTKDVIAAVTNAGGIGVFGADSKTPEELRSDVRWIRERVSQPSRPQRSTIATSEPSPSFRPRSNTLHGIATRRTLWKLRDTGEAKVCGAPLLEG